MRMFKHYVSSIMESNEIIDEYIDGPYEIPLGTTLETTSLELDGILYTTYWVEENDVPNLNITSYMLECDLL